MNERRRVILYSLVPCWIALLVNAPELKAQQAETRDPSTGQSPIQKREDTTFIRVLTDEYGQPIALQTPTVRYIRRDDSGNIELEVYLESVIHIADASYYRGFDKRFDDPVRPFDGPFRGRDERLADSDVQST